MTPMSIVYHKQLIMLLMTEKTNNDWNFNQYFYILHDLLFFTVKKPKFSRRIPEDTSFIGSSATRRGTFRKIENGDAIEVDPR